MIDDETSDDIFHDPADESPSASVQAPIRQELFTLDVAGEIVEEVVFHVRHEPINWPELANNLNERYGLRLTPKQVQAVAWQVDDLAEIIAPMRDWPAVG